MKILAVSLLRIGDLIMHEMVIESVRRQYPESEIQILVNDVGESYITSQTWPAKVHVLPRTQLQRMLVEKNRSRSRASQLLSELVAKINVEKFDWIIDFSHTSFSARLLDLLQANKKSGAQFQEGKAVVVHGRTENPWSIFFNDQYTRNPNLPIHYLNILADCFHLSLQPPPARAPRKTQRIALQITTSDPKKDWPLKNFLELAALLRSQFPEISLTVLGAPNESAQLNAHFGVIPGIHVRSLRWAELATELQDTDLLVTGDTSIQHFAVKLGTPLISLFLGSANRRRTAPAQLGALILQPRNVCLPCAHSKSCSQLSHECGDSLLVDDVFETIRAKLQGLAPQNLKSQLFIVKQRNGRLFTEKCGEGVGMINLRQALAQLTWQVFLDREHLRTVGPYGSTATLLFNEFFNDLKAPLKKHQIQADIQQRLSQLTFDHAKLALWQTQAFSMEGPELVASVQAHLFQSKDSKDYFFGLLHACEDVAYRFTQLKAIRQALGEARTLVEIEMKILKTLNTILEERNFIHVTRARTLSEACPPAP